MKLREWCLTSGSLASFFLRWGSRPYLINPTSVRPDVSPSLSWGIFTDRMCHDRCYSFHLKIYIGESVFYFSECACVYVCVGCHPVPAKQNMYGVYIPQIPMYLFIYRGASTAVRFYLWRHLRRKIRYVLNGKPSFGGCGSLKDSIWKHVGINIDINMLVL